MAEFDHEEHYDVVVVGGGSAGVAAAIAAARGGARTVLVESNPMAGGELLSGLPVLGTLNARAEWIAGGIARELLEGCAQLDGYVGPVCDWRLIWYACADPEVMKIVVAEALARHGVSLLLHTFAEGVAAEGGRVKGVVVLNKRGRTLLTGDVFIDCSGDGDVCAMAGAPFEAGGEGGALQPVSLTFRMMGVEAGPLLEFVRDHPENIAVGESEVLRAGRSDAELALELFRQGLPAAFFKGEGPLLSEAIGRGEMYPTALVMITPASMPRREVTLNTTRIAGVDARRTDALSATLSELAGQVKQCVAFLKRRVPGFEAAHLAAIAPRIGVRETRRIVGECVLSEDDVLEGRKRRDGVAKGSHHVDIHGEGTAQVRIPVAHGGSYDIPFGCLVPKGLRNVLVAGRCFSSDRAANGSARVMGTCMAMGQAAGTAAALCAGAGAAGGVRELEVESLRARLAEQGAVLEGTF